MPKTYQAEAAKAIGIAPSFYKRISTGSPGVDLNPKSYWSAVKI